MSCVLGQRANHFLATALYKSRGAVSASSGLRIRDGESAMCVPSAGRRMSDTNAPVVSVALRGNFKLQLDMATLTKNQGRLMVTRHAGHPIARGLGLDAPDLLVALLPSGGRKARESYSSSRTFSQPRAPTRAKPLARCSRGPLGLEGLTQVFVGLAPT